MMKKIKRTAALTVAGILLICISFASLAEGMPEESSAPEEANASAAAEITGEPNDIPAAAETAETNEAPEAASINDSIPAENNEAPADNREPETTEQNNARESAEGNGNSANIDYDIVIDDYDAGSVDPELVKLFFPNGGGNPDTASDDTETAENGNNAPADYRIWIETLDNTAIRAGETVTLTAKAEQELNGTISWEIRDPRWEENVWQTIGTGASIRIEVTEAMMNHLVRFLTEDGTVSEIFEIIVTEEPEGETSGEASGEQNAEKSGEATGNNEEQTEVQDDAADVETVENTETPVNDAADEEPAAITRAWISAEYDGDLQEGASVILTANAEPEMTGVNIWETFRVQDEDSAWTRLGYGDQMTVEITGENIGNLYRFVMQDGTISEEFRLSSLPKDEETAENETETSEEAEDSTGEPEEIPFPEDAGVSFVITWEGEAKIGGTAVFTASIEGLDEYEYSMQWQQCTDGENWLDVADETGIQMRQVITEENMAYLWRINITVTGTKEAETLL